MPDAAAVAGDGAGREQALRHVLDTPLLQPRRPERRLSARRWRGVAAIVIALLGLTAGALATSGVLSGRPYQPPRGLPVDRRPQAGLGVAVAGTAQLLPVRVPDPAGGPPWGMRVLRTTRGLECVQVGRVVDAQLGVLGQDGVAGDDHRFHVLAADLVQPEDCVTLDAHRNAFMGNDTNTAYASGPVLDRSCAYPGEGSGQPPCPGRDQRMVAYGLLGPRARSLTYRAAGGEATVATVGRQGAYLVVRPASARGDTGLAAGSPGGFPGAVAITYANGRSCRPQPPAGRCVLDGYSVATLPRLRVGHVPVQVAVRRSQRAGRSYADLLVRFRAPVAITAANRAYTLALKLPPACGTIDYASVDRNVERGARVRLKLTGLPGDCPGTATAYVEITQATAGAGPDMVALGPVVTSIATFKLELPSTNGAIQPHRR